MNFLTPILIAIIVPIVLNVMKNAAENAKPTEKRVVRFHKAILILGIVIAVFWLAIALICYLSGGGLFNAMVFAAFSLLGLFCIVAYINCRGEYDEDGFSLRSFWGRTKRYKYTDITGIKTEQMDTWIYVGKRRFSVGAFDVGGGEFLKAIRKQYKKANDGKAIPRCTSDIYHGNVEGGSALFALLLIIGAFFAAMWIMLSIGMMNQNYEKDALQGSIIFTDMSTSKEGDINYYDAEGNNYRIEYYVTGMINKDDLPKANDTASDTVIYYGRMKPEYRDEYFKIYAISVNGNFILDFDTSERAYYEHNKWVIPVIGVLVILMFASIGLSIPVGRNPDKYPRLFKFFFKSRAR